MHYSLLMFLVVSLPLDPAPPQARPCRGTVLVEADTTIALFGPETQTLLKVDVRRLGAGVSCGPSFAARG